MARGSPQDEPPLHRTLIGHVAKAAGRHLRSFLNQENTICAPRPIHHHKRESIDAHLTVVFAALAVTRLIEDRTGWSIKRFVRAARRYRTVHIRAGQQVLTAEDPLPNDLRDALAVIT